MSSSSISSHLFRGTSYQARDEIKKTRSRQGYCIVSFLYFAQAMKFDIYIDTVNNRYKTGLIQSDLIFIDGIAMQIFDRCGQGFFEPKHRIRSENLNGTDFLPFLLHQTKNNKVGIIMSSVYDPGINKGPERLQKGLDKLQELFPHIDIIYSHQSLYKDRGQNFPFEQVEKALENSDTNYDYLLFLNGIGAPLQEERAQEHKAFFEKHQMIVLNNGATIDYYSGFETRAPQRAVKARVLETFRRVATQPSKNLHKFVSMFKIISYR